MLNEIFLYWINSSVNVFKSKTIKTLSSSCFATYFTSESISFPLDSVIVTLSPTSAFFAASLFNIAAK